MIYGLIDEKTNELKYIGRTCQPVSQRRRDHKYKAKSGKEQTPKSKWLREVGVENFDLIVLEENVDDNLKAETQWINRADSFGHDLTNVYKGGNGKRRAEVKVSDEIIEMMGEASDRKIADKLGMSPTTIRKKTG